MRDARSVTYLVETFDGWKIYHQTHEVRMDQAVLKLSKQVAHQAVRILAVDGQEGDVWLLKDRFGTGVTPRLLFKGRQDRRMVAMLDLAEDLVRVEEAERKNAPIIERPDAEWKF